jgi:hypothetical protein
MFACTTAHRQRFFESAFSSLQIFHAHLANFPLEIMSMAMSQSVEARAGTSGRVTGSGRLYTHNGNGGGALSMSYRRSLTTNMWMEVCAARTFTCTRVCRAAYPAMAIMSNQVSN